MTLGLHGKLTPEEARKRAAKLLGAVADGADPAEERAAAKRALTVADLAELYLSEGPAEKPNKKASSWAADRSNIERHINPSWAESCLKYTHRTQTSPNSRLT